jgi:hypothetical protein
MISRTFGADGERGTWAVSNVSMRTILGRESIGRSNSSATTVVKLSPIAFARRAA